MELDHHSGGEARPKRKMKSAAQLEVLERTYSTETYPSESLRAELSVQLGLTDRQLQMWFCHRRLKDKKVNQNQNQNQNQEFLNRPVGTVVGGVMRNEGGLSGSGSGSSQFEPRKAVARVQAAVVLRVGNDVPVVSRYYEPPAQSASELRAIAFVEAQLGGPVRVDGPVLGMEFDPLPPGAFDAPIAITGQQIQTGRSYDENMYDRRDTKPIKTPSSMPNVEPSYLPSSSGGKRKLTPENFHVVHPQVSVRAPHEYQFLPEQPSAKSETYRRVDPSHYYNSGIDAPSLRVSSISEVVPYHHAKEHVNASCGFQGQVPTVSVVSLEGRAGHVLSSAPTVYGSPHRTPITNVEVDSQICVLPAVGIENRILNSDRQGSHEEEALRIERKRKSEEVRIAREAEAHEKRIRKELEKQDIIRRKREEQMRREMERHDRERRKEEERLMREKQREEERFQREQQRELERRERFLLKENLRAERMRQKEELRKEKEAARLKAANERATARRIAKESTELIEDERLELMELAVSEKRLPSMLSLDSETLQNLDLFRDKLSAFPPKSIQLKKPFTVQPWADSDENVSNLLMVWRFLITFTDVLELWPFTLDEFVQAMHDYEPRLLCEIHVSLLRSIIKDIEDVARTPSIGLGASQNSGANPGGGHPQIVEGAYAWGFDIRCWQRHLNPLTWPEILRQFALSAGFGPQLKKRSLELAYVRDDNEGLDGVDIVSTLRNGAAAESALAVMQAKGFSQPRKSRHRLTPGTVKFAAFHILSLEGSKGLTVLEVVEKIQKSGLRDLTTSKTPEASVAAALSRDGKLFERTAPSTYCVKAAFRKDPVDAEALLSAAREKIQIFENGFSDSEVDKDTEEAADVEKDLDSECDVAEDPEDVNVGIANSFEEVLHSTKATTSKSAGCSINRPKHVHFGSTPQNGFMGNMKGSSSFHIEDKKGINCMVGAINHSIDAAVNCNISTDPEIDESNSGEPWVQGLMEGEYSDLTVEERLSALVALVGVAIEGNSIRVILEERLEAANALKKQMWAEAQIDKRRIKEEYVTKFHYPSYTGIKTDPLLTNSVVDENQNPYVVDNKNNETSFVPSVKQESPLGLHNSQNNFNNLPTERIIAGNEFSAGQDSLAQHHGFAAEKSRAQLKAYIGHKAEEMYVYRSLPLGQDRRHNRYWQFVTSASRNDPGSARIFFESQGGCWRLIDSEEGFDALLASLDTRGIRESHLHSMLQKLETTFKEAVRGSLKHSISADPGGVTTKSGVSEMNFSPNCSTGKESPSSTLCDDTHDTQDQSTSFKIELGKIQSDKKSALKRYQDFQKWMWKECSTPSILCAMKFGKKRCTNLLITCELCHDSSLSDSNHCSVCHMNFGTFHNNMEFSSHVKQCEKQQKLQPKSLYHGSDSSQPLRIRLLKLQMALIEAFVPEEAFHSIWTDDYRKSWGRKLQSSSSAEELLQLLTLLEGAIQRDYLSSSFETTKELLGSSTSAGFAVDSFYNGIPGVVPVLPWVPQTTAAVALRLMELDASISYMMQQKLESHKEEEVSEFNKLPSRYTVVRNTQEIEHEFPNQTDYPQEQNQIKLRVEFDRYGRGRGHSRNRGGRKLQKGGIGLRAEFGKQNASGIRRKSQTRGRGRRRGRRTIRIRQKPAEKKVDQGTAPSQFGVTLIPEQNTILESPSSCHRANWEEEIRGMQVEDDDDSNSIEAMDSDDNGQVRYEYGNQGTSYGGMFHHKSEDFTVSEDIDVDGEEEGDGVEDYLNMGSEYGEGDENDGGGISLSDDDVESASSGYSV